MHGPAASAAGAARPRMMAAIAVPLATLAVFLVLLALFPDRYVARLAALVAFWTALGMSWNLIGGYAGQLSLGHAAFVGIGAFVTLLLQQQFDLTPWLGLIASTVAAAFAALAMGMPTLRLSGIYFSLATLAYPLIFQILFVYWGFQETFIPAHPEAPWWYMQWPDPRYYAVIFAVICTAIWTGTALLDRSSLKYLLVAIREDEPAAASVGIDTWKVKLQVFVVSGALAGLLGAVYGQMLIVIAPDTVFGLNVSVQAIVSNFAGGIGRVTGPIVGTLLTVPVSQILEAYLGHLTGVSQFAYGIVLILVILLIPGGVVEAFERLRPRERLVRWSRGTADADVGAGRPVLPDPVRAVVPRRPPPAANRAPLLSVAGLSKSYHGVVALKDVDFDVYEGQFVGIVGPNGAGKTTLFDLMTGFQSPTSGRLRLAGEDMTGLAAHSRSDRGIRRTFQVPRPFGRLTAMENVVLGAVRRYMPGQETAEEAAAHALRLVGLGAAANRLASGLGPSQLKLLEVARALAGNPVMLLLDEPLAGLDPTEVAEVLAILEAQHRAGLTVVLVDHDVAAVAGAVERLIVIDNGRLIVDGEPGAVTRSPRVVEAYLGRRWADA